MKAVILCGGRGTRLREETEYRPKPMVPVGGRPILWHILRSYAHYGCRDFVLCLGYKGEIIRDYFLNYEYLNSDITVTLGRCKGVKIHDGANDACDWTVTLADTGAETMTGGRLKRVEPHLDEDDFFMTYGDGLADVRLDELLAYHRRMGRIATVTGLHPLSRFGVLEVDGKGLVTRFREKPQLDGLINGGFFVFKRAVFDYLDADCVLEREPMRRLAEDGQMAVFEHRGFWKSMDTYRDYLDFNTLWDGGQTPWKVW